MFKIVSKKELTPNVKYFEVHAPAVSHKSHPGQFVIVRAKETGERLPITIAGSSPEKGTVDIYFAEMLACVKTTIRAWEFPKPEGGKVIIAKTFNFKKKDR